MIDLESQSIRMFLLKVTLAIGQEEFFLPILFSKIKTEKKQLEVFMKKNYKSVNE